MDHRTLEITLQSGKDLNKVNLITKMDVYAVVSISGGDKASKQKTKTPVDHDGDANPTWNYAMKFRVDEAALQMNRLILDFKLVCERAMVDKEVGEVSVPIKELLDSSARAAADSKQIVSYQVRKPSGKPKGQLTFSYKFSDKTAAVLSAPPYAAAAPAGKSDFQPFSAYPAGPVSGYSPPGAYPPPSGYPPIDGRSHYPPPAAYPAANGSGSYPPPAVEGSHYPPPAVQAAYPAVDQSHYPPPAVPAAYPAVEGSGTYPSPAAYPVIGGSGNYPPPAAYAEGSGNHSPAPGHPAVDGAPKAGGYPPPPPTGYPSPPPYGYGYPPPQPGFRYPPAQVAPKKNKFGMGLGAGLLGGAIGGLLIGDAVSDVGDFGGFDC